MTENLEDMKKTVQQTARELYPEIPTGVLDDILDAENSNPEDFTAAKNKVFAIVERYLDSLED